MKAFKYWSPSSIEAALKLLTPRRGPAEMDDPRVMGGGQDLLPTMKRLPVDIFELDFPVDLVHARAVLGPDAVILGNVNTVEEMLTGSPEEVYAAAAECHRICGSNHVVGTGCEVAPETPPENLHALVAYARDHAPGEVPLA